MKKLLLVLMLIAAPVSAQSLYDFSLKANWDALYEVGAEGAWGHPNTRDEVQLNYHRFAVLPIARDHARNLAAALGWTGLSRVIVVHCGFGWFLEALAELGITQSICATTFAYIQNNKSLNEDADLTTAVQSVGLATNVGDGLTLFTTFRGDGGARAKRAAVIFNESLTTNQSRQAIRTAVGGGSGYDVFTYDGFLNAHTDAEALALSGELHKLAGSARLIHHVYPNWLNFKTLEQWKALLPADTFIEHETWRVL